MKITVKNEKPELNEKFGYCAENGGRCDGLECSIYNIEDDSDWQLCSDRVSVCCDE